VELFEVLTRKEQEHFDLEQALKRINQSVALMVRGEERG
jgi:hypothetical protein